jgi:capsid assembly protease
MPGHDKLVNELAFDGKTTGPEAAVAVLKAEKELRGKAKQDLADDAPPPVVTPPSADNQPAATDLTTEAGMKAAWDKNKNGVQDEFGGDFEVFKAYCEAEKKGRFKVLNK